MATVSELTAAITLGQQHLDAARLAYASARELAIGLSDDLGQIGMDGTSRRCLTVAERLTAAQRDLATLIATAGKLADSAARVGIPDSPS